MKRNFLFILLLFFCGCFSAQELNCNLQINSSQIQIANKQVFETLQKELNDFMNNRHWTSGVYSVAERIDCNFMITIQSYADNVFSTELQVQARRPVYNSSYNTSTFNFKDEHFNFTYVEFDPIEINTTTYESNLTAVLAYYAYIIIGLDLDSYSKLGGTECFRQAENIVNLMQSKSDQSEALGWKAFESNRNRYALINNLMDERFRKYREFFYTYHRQGLDEMVSNVSNARAKIAEGLPILREINRMQPSAVAIQTFLDSKNEEIINLFSKKGTTKEKNDVYEIMTDVNPTLTSRYEAIKQ
ncbi:MAG: DUF4835 family protein [Paludibacteraceae bacterium]|jgi:hypothetical protein|nr:DUF4835 family protein [Paludibacteraceae bacterium]